MIWMEKVYRIKQIGNKNVSQEEIDYVEYNAKNLVIIFESRAIWYQRQTILL